MHAFQHRRCHNQSAVQVHGGKKVKLCFILPFPESVLPPTAQIWRLSTVNVFSFCAAKSCRFKYIQDVSSVHWCLLSAISGGMFLLGELLWQQNTTRAGSKFDVLTPQNTARLLANLSRKNAVSCLQLANRFFFSQRPHRRVRKLQGPRSSTPFSALCAALACMAMEFPCI